MEQMAIHRQQGSPRYGMLKRRYQRTGIDGFVADIAVGDVVLGGIVSDISSGGFKMSKVAETFAVEKHSYTTIISGGGRHYKILAKPCWSRIDASSHLQEIGFKIVDASWEWTEFVLNTASDADYEDDWGFHA
jgi:hypothetical protein